MTGKQITLSILAGLTILLGFIWFAKPNGASDGPKDDLGITSILSAQEKFFDFGEISMKNGIVSHDFEIKNEIQAEIVITKLYTSCMCTEATLVMPDNRRVGPFGMPGHGAAAANVRETLVPGEKATVVVNFDPNAHGPAGIGLMERIVRIETSNGAPLELKFRVRVTP